MIWRVMETRTILKLLYNQSEVGYDEKQIIYRNVYAAEQQRDLSDYHGHGR